MKNRYKGRRADVAPVAVWIRRELVQWLRQQAVPGRKLGAYLGDLVACERARVEERARLKAEMEPAPGE